VNIPMTPATIQRKEVRDQEGSSHLKRELLNARLATHASEALILIVIIATRVSTAYSVFMLREMPHRIGQSSR
jgi:hypothetical protein